MHYNIFHILIRTLDMRNEKAKQNSKQQFKAKSEKTLSDSYALYQEQIQSLKEACRAKDVMISKLLETTENLSSNKNYNNCNTTATNKTYNNDSKIPRWCHHSGIYYQQLLIQQQPQIMGDRLRLYQAFQLKSNYVR